MALLFNHHIDIGSGWGKMTVCFLSHESCNTKEKKVKRSNFMRSLFISHQIKVLRFFIEVCGDSEMMATDSFCVGDAEGFPNDNIQYDGLRMTPGRS